MNADSPKPWYVYLIRAANEALQEPPGAAASTVVPAYKHPGKNWRLKRAAVPQWYKSRAGVRTRAQSGAARVARYRPRKFH